jgi:hypothetical protein
MLPSPGNCHLVDRQPSVGDDHPVKCDDQKEYIGSPRESHLVCSDYWTRKCPVSESRTGERDVLDQTVFLTASTEHLRARVPVGSNFFVDYMNVSLGAYREGEGTRESKRKKKMVKLNHRDETVGVVCQLSWGNPVQM